MSDARSSTATGTTVANGSAPDRPRPYRGRFAPSPTGPLHLGSLLTAVGSYLQARVTGGQWILRLEDLDTPRVVPGAAEDILRTLERFGFEWDGPVLWQSSRQPAYEAALSQLLAQGLVIAGVDGIGPQYFRPTERDVIFVDGLQGPYTQNVASHVGDFVIKRYNGLFAYQLAVVVDDAEQQITQIVRGCDLLDNTPRQILLQEALGLSTPSYWHLPLLTESTGRKLAKSQHALPLAAADPTRQLLQALTLLGQRLPTVQPTAPEIVRVAPTSPQIASETAPEAAPTLQAATDPKIAPLSLPELWSWAIAHSGSHPSAGCAFHSTLAARSRLIKSNPAPSTRLLHRSLNEPIWAIAQIGLVSRS